MEILIGNALYLRGVIKVLGLDSQLAVTVFLSVVVSHEPRGEITEIDLENYLSKVVWKSFDTLRNEAANRLGVSEVDLILAGVRVVGMKVDGHEVLNPHGFIGKMLEVSICITMVKRGVLTTDKSEKERVEVFEEGSVSAYLIAKSLGFNHLLYLEIGDNLTKIFLVTPTRTSYLNEFSWGKFDIMKAYVEHFGILEETAFQMYLKFVSGDASLTVLKKTRGIFYAAFKRFVDAVTLNIRNFSELSLTRLPPIYIKSDFPLPSELYKKPLVLGRKRTKLVGLGLTVNISDLINNPPYNVYEWLNQLAKRRIKWIMP